MAKASNKGGTAPATPRNTGKGNKGKGSTTATAPAVQDTADAAPQQEAAPAKAKRPPAVVQNGVPRPRAGGLCAAVWEITENLANGGELPAIAAVKAAAAAQGLNPTNVSIEYYRCRQFHGVRGRQPKAPAAAPEAAPQQ